MYENQTDPELKLPLSAKNLNLKEEIFGDARSFGSRRNKSNPF